MPDDESARALWPLTVAELVGLVIAGLVLLASLTGATTLLASVSRPARLAALAFVVVELLIPAYVFVDSRRSGLETNDLWVHAAAMPVISLFALAGYVDERRRAAREAVDRDP
jgi:hypothetical protein